jgi:cellulose synthase/poly-beta-1,6-N-acetylglucosamine synthase-like glycosyltransferase
MDNFFWFLLLLLAILLAGASNFYLWLRDRLTVQRFLANRPRVPKLNPPGGNLPRVSFVVAAWNEEDRIRRFLEAVFRLSYPNYELVLCAGGQDQTLKIASEYQDEKFILLEQLPGEGKQRSLQRGLEKATGEIIYLIDADCLINDSVFAWTLAPLINQGEQAVSGSMCMPFPEQINEPFVINQCASHLYAAIHQPAYSFGLLGGNCAVSRKALDLAGDFRTEVRTGTDYDLAKRLLQQGIRIRSEMNASIMSKYPTLISAYYRQQRRWVRNVVLHGLRFKAYGDVLACLRTSLVGFGMLLMPFLAIFLSLFPGIPVTIANIMLAGWILGLLFAFLSRLRYLSMARSLLGMDYPIKYWPNLFYYLLLDIIAWSWVLFEYPLKNLRHQW